MQAHILEHAGHDHGSEDHAHSMEDLEPFLFMIAGIFLFYILDIGLFEHLGLVSGSGEGGPGKSGHGHSHGKPKSKPKP